MAYHFDKPTLIGQATLVLDSNLERGIALQAPGRQEPFPENLPRRFRLEIRRHGDWEPVAVVTDNAQRLVTLPVNEEATGLRFVLEETHGGAHSHVYGFFADAPHVGVDRSRL